jgi:hypothetical protein
VASGEIRNSLTSAMLLSHDIQQSFRLGFIRKLILAASCTFFLFSAAWLNFCSHNEISDHRLATARISGGENENNALRSSASRSEKEQPYEAIQETIETSISFSGWKGECAVLRKEAVLEDSQVRTLFVMVMPDSGEKLLDYSKWDNRKSGELPLDPPGLQMGRVVVSDFKAIEEFPKVLMEIEADEAEVRAIEDSLVHWKQGKDVISAKALLRIRCQLSKTDILRTVWVESIILSPYFGETGLEFTLPELMFASISPTEKMLIVFISDGEETDYLLIRTGTK